MRLFVSLLLLAAVSEAFAPIHFPVRQTALFSAPPPPSAGGGGGGGDEDKVPDPEGANLAAELFRMAQQKGVQIDEDDLDDEDDEDDDDESGFKSEFDTPPPSFTDDKLYSEVKERVLDTAGGFVSYVQGQGDGDADSDDSEDSDDLVTSSGDPSDSISATSSDYDKPYVPPEVVPDPELTAGEVVLQVLKSLKFKDEPLENAGVAILLDYHSDSATVIEDGDITVEEYYDFLSQSEYKVLFEHDSVMIDKGSYSYDGKKAYYTARLQTGPNPADVVSVNFILSSDTVDDDDIPFQSTREGDEEKREEIQCWRIDSMLIRPESMRRRRRR